MGARGRKSGTEVATATAMAVVARPDAPLDLTPEQAQEWAEIVDSLPADWFTRENFPLLAQYCRHTVEARRLAQLIDQECARKNIETAAYIELLRAQRQESSALKTLAASMRLAQQARYQARGAERAKGRIGTVKRPWESD